MHRIIPAILTLLINATAFSQNSCDSLQVGFTYDPDPAGIQFTDTSIVNGPIVWYQWNFGDGNISFAQDPVHGYDVNGTYEVCLIISTQIDVDGEMITCTDTTCQMVVYDEGSGFTCDQYQASFEFEITEENTVVFFSTTDPPGGEYLWQFGDGSQGSGLQVTHVYDVAATYNACLVSYIWSDASQEFCTSSICSPIVLVASDCSGVETGFTSTQLSPYGWSFVSTSTPIPSGYSWQISDGTVAGGAQLDHTFDVPGTYEVCLGTWWAIAGGDSCWSNSCQIIQVVDSVPCDPDLTASFSYEITPDGVSFTAAPDTMDGWLWDLGDGTMAAGMNVIHLFDTVGPHTVCLDVWYWNESLQDTCWANVCQVITLTGCDPDFSVSIQAENDGVEYTFTAIGVLEVNGFIWDLGDGATGGGEVISHDYSAGGPIEVCVDAWYWNEIIQDTCWANDCITIDPPVGIINAHTGEWTIWPQPADAFIFISAPATTIEMLRLISIEGREMLSIHRPVPPIGLDVSDLPAGTYLLECVDRDRTHHRSRVIIGR